MKPSKLKLPKTKASNHYQKNSSISLARLLQIGSYKKIVRDLEYKNYLITEELHRTKTQHHEHDAKNKKQVMLAKLKLNGMADTINKLFADMTDMQICLDEIMSSSEIKLQEKGFAHPKEIVSTVDCIKEVSVLSPSDPPFTQNTNLPPDIHNSSSLSDDKSQNSDEMVLANSQTCDPERCEVSASLLPVLFVEDNGTDVQETNIKDGIKFSERKIDKECNKSLTPELDIDLSCFRREKSNSTSQTQFNPSHPRETKSRGTSSPASSSLLLPPGENILLPMKASTNCSEAKVSNSRKTKSKGKTSLEAQSSLFDSEPIGCGASSKACSSSCQPVFSGFETEQSTLRNMSPGVISPPLQCEESFVQASHSTKHSLIKVAEILPDVLSNVKLLAAIANKTLLLSEEMEITCENATNPNLDMLKTFVENNTDLPYDCATSKILPAVSHINKTLLFDEDMMIIAGEVSSNPMQEASKDIEDKCKQLCSETIENKFVTTKRSKKRVAKQFLDIGEPTSSMDVKGCEARPRRQTKLVDYKEPSLRKKMRRVVDN